MRILVIFTGGTIGSTVNGCIKNCLPITTTYPADFLLLKGYGESQNILLESLKNIFEVECPFTILSENSNMFYIEKIISILNNINVNEYDGVIITHGTDTLAFSTSIISLLFGNIKIPIIFVSSNEPINIAKSNGLENFINAVKLVESKIYGVFAVFKNPDGKSLIHFGSRLLQSTSYSDSFTSIGDKYFGEIINNKLIIKENPIYNNFKFEIPNTLNKNILYIKLYPGINFDLFNFKNCDAVFLEGYHSFTAPCETNSANYAFDFQTGTVQYAAKLARYVGIKVFLAPFKSSFYSESHDLIYKTTLQIIETENIFTINDCSVYSAFAKLIIAYSIAEIKNDQEKLNAFLAQELSFEKI